MNLYRILFKNGNRPQFIEAFDLETVRQFMRSLGYIEPAIIIEEF